jgi:hypothetical protein
MKLGIRIIGVIFLTGLVSHRSPAQNLSGDSKYFESISHNYSDSVFGVKNKAVSGSLFLGYGFFNGNISNYFSNPFFIGLSLELHRGKLFFQFENRDGTLKTKETLIFPDKEAWEKDEYVFSFTLGINIGYSFINTPSYRFATMAGIGLNCLMTPLSVLVPDNSEVKFYLPYCKIGFLTDVKTNVSGRYKQAINYRAGNYSGIRLGFGIDMPVGTSEYPEYTHGPLIFFSVGISSFNIRK